MNLSNNIKSQYLLFNKTIATNTSEKAELRSPYSPDKIRFGSDLELLLNQEIETQNILIDNINQQQNHNMTSAKKGSSIPTFSIADPGFETKY
jgi:hypothetical protein